MQEKRFKINLMEDMISDEEIGAINACLKSGEYTQGKVVHEFETKFAEWNGSKYAVMVNSGSSANLLIATMLRENYGLNDGDEVLVPAVTWPTTVYPLIQNNLFPVFCDIDDSFNLSVESAKKMITPKTRAIFLVHLLGQTANLDGLIEICKEKNIVLIEDCCEALGALHKGKKAGNFGVMGSFSFFFGHHMTTIEGGMITTDDLRTYDLLKSIRSHGWVRNSLRIKDYERTHTNFNYLFDFMGYNVRSTNLNASIGLEQLKKIDQSIKIRRENHRLFEDIMSRNNKITLQKVNLDDTSSFCLPLILPSIKERDLLLRELPKDGIECRTVVGGNLVRQPVFSHRLKDKYRKDECKNADIIHHNGLYLPNNQFIDSEKVLYMTDKVNKVLEKDA